MSPSYLPFDLTRILSFNLELGRDEKLRHLGAILDQQVLDIKGNTIEAINQLEQLAQQADMILGHNILDFDLPGSPVNLCNLNTFLASQLLIRSISHH